MTTLRIVPLSLKTANDAVLQWHRHHKPTSGHKWSLGCISGGVLVGVAICGRPVARMLDNGMTIEVNRLATDGTPNACSFLYGACKRVAREMGYERILTYILATEPGTSLRAAGWTTATTPQISVWDRPGRPRTDAPHSEIAKVRWDCWLVPEAIRTGHKRLVFGDESVAA